MYGVSALATQNSHRCIERGSGFGSFHGLGVTDVNIQPVRVYRRPGPGYNPDIRSRRSLFSLELVELEVNPNLLIIWQASPLELNRHSDSLFPRGRIEISGIVMRALTA
jgi:hypothetical protein